MKAKRSGVLDKIDRLSEGIKWMGAYAVLALILFLALNVILRYFFERPMVFTEEITGYFLAFIVFMGLGYTLKVGGHVSTDVLTRHFPAGMKRALKFPILIGGIILAVFLTLAAWLLMIKNYSRQTIDFGSLGTPEWIPNLIFVIGSSFFLLQMIALLRSLRRRK